MSTKQKQVQVEFLHKPAYSRDGMPLNIGEGLLAPKPIKYDELATKHIQKSKKNALSDQAKDIKYNIKLHAKLKSFRSKDHHFCNYLKNICSDHYCEALRNILPLEGSTLPLADLPISMSEEPLRINSRIRAILKCGEVYEGQKDGDIRKCAYISRHLNTTPLPNRNEEVRVFFQKNGSDLEIVALDLYHLLATGNRPKYIEKYKKVSDYNTCFTDLKGLK